MPHTAKAATPFYSFQALIQAADGRRERVAVFYCSTEAVDLARFKDGITELNATYLVPDRLILLGRRPILLELWRAAVEPDVVDRVPEATRYAHTPSIEVVTFDVEGRLSTWTGPRDAATDLVESDLSEAVWNQQDALALMSAGLEIIMHQHGVILQATGYHFCKPSNRHSDRFIRAANALRYGSEVSFIAANLLRLLPDRDFRSVYTDTSSINSVAYALRDHLNAFDALSNEFTIDSFGSYSGADGEFNIEDSTGLVLISATTSGGLNRELERKTNIASDRFITLCYIGAEPLKNVVCDLTDRGNDKDKPSRAGLHKPFPSWEPEDCVLCERGYPLVHISGDQFLPANPNVTKAMIMRADAPGWLSDRVQQLRGCGVVRCHVATEVDPEPRSLYLDLEPIVEKATPDPDAARTVNDGPGERIAAQLERRLMRDVPAGTSWIVHLDDPASKLLAAKAAEYLTRAGREIAADHVISQSALADMEPDSMPGLVLVVGSTVVSGRSILNVSQALRTTHGDNPISYLVLVARSPHQTKIDEIRSNLGYGNGRMGEHAVSVLLDLHLPDDRQGVSSPWSMETQFWKEVRDGLDADRFPDRLAWIEARMQVLNDAASPAQRGFTDHLFLANDAEKGDELRLQPNFAFWSFEYAPEEVAQSEVFLTVTAILHHMRGDRRRLVSLTHEHNQTVLDPAVFARFNDAIIQACLLRATLPHELDYAAQPEYSRDMLEVLKPIVREWKTDGAATAEILYALASGHLKLQPEHVQDVLSALGSETLPEPLGALFAVIEDNAPNHQS